MLNEKEIKEIVKKEGVAGEVIGYEYYEGLKRLVLMFKTPDDPHDTPTMGAGWYIDEKTKKMDTMLLIDMLDYDGKIKTVKF